MTAVVEARNVSRVFPMAGAPVTALRDVSLRVAGDDYVSVAGPSGCGKSTLLHVLGCVDVPTSGRVLFRDADVGSLPDAERSRLRLRHRPSLPGHPGAAPPPQAFRLTGW